MRSCADGGLSGKDNGMDLFADFLARTHRAIAQLAAQGVLPANLALTNVVVEPPRDAAHGDVAINAAMVLAKAAGKPPRVLADALVEILRTDPDVADASVAGAGFINLTLQPHILQHHVQRALQLGADYARSDLGHNAAVNIEYVSANPTGPMHVGHGRGAIVGDALAGLLAYVGHNVTREYYINDAGAQVQVLARSVELRYKEALGHAIGDMPEGCYPGEYLIAVGQALAQQHGDALLQQPEAARLQFLQQYAVNAMMELIKADLAAAGITHQVFTSEKALTDAGAIPKALQALTQANCVYTGTLPPPKGKPIDDYEPHPQLLFKSSDFGDDTDRPLQKADGSTTYFSADVAYHADKYARGFTRLINVWGADHGGYIKRVQAACLALHPAQQPPEVLLCQLVHLYRDGQPYKMSKRSGNFVTLRDVIDDVGADAFRFMMLTRRHDAALDFDVAAVRAQSKDNPVFYVQYAHARICSVLRNAGLDHAALLNADLSLLQHPSERALMAMVARFPRQIRQAALSLEPHRVVLAATEAAAQFHSHWALGNTDAQLRFIIDNNPQLTTARLALISAVAGVIATSLQIVGVVPCLQM